MAGKKKIPSALEEGSAAAAFLEQTESKKKKSTSKPKAEQKKKAPTLKEVQEKTPDLPEKPTDPGQGKIFDERKVDFPIPEQKKKMGQPRKYDEPTKSISFKLPESAIETLKDLAFAEHTNATQILLSLIERRAAEQKKVLDALKVIKEGEKT